MVRRAIDSVLRQTYGSIEIVVVIDGPDEATRTSLRAVADERLRVLALEQSVGGSDARNLGVKHARSEWIALLDDDDEWMPDKIEKQMALAADAAEPYPVIASPLIAKSPYGDFLWPRRFPREAEPMSEYLFSRKTLFAGEGQIQTSMIVARKSLMELVPFTSGLKKHQDLDWYLRVARTAGAKFYFVPEPLVNLYVEENRDAITNRSDWRFSLEYLRKNRELMTPRGYAGFVSAIICSEAAKQGDWGAVPVLLKEMLVKGRPTFMDVMLFAARWVMRPSLRGKLRSFRHSIAVKHAA
jgi:glycosyltransferase involved in cell wall biosynthesis